MLFIFCTHVIHQHQDYKPDHVYYSKECVDPVILSSCIYTVLVREIYPCEKINNKAQKRTDSRKGWTDKKSFGPPPCMTKRNEGISIYKPNPPRQTWEKIVAETSYRTNKYTCICFYFHTKPGDQVCKCNKQQRSHHCVEYRLSYIFFILYGVQQDYQLAYYCD